MREGGCWGWWMCGGMDGEVRCRLKLAWLVDNHLRLVA